jgi:hypothetical protein
LRHFEVVDRCGTVNVFDLGNRHERESATPDRSRASEWRPFTCSDRGPDATLEIWREPRFGDGDLIVAVELEVVALLCPECAAIDLAHVRRAHMTAREDA